MNGDESSYGSINGDPATPKAPLIESHMEPESPPPLPAKKGRRAFPPAVIFIIASEFCERFSFYGMRAILTLYFSQEHGYSDHKAVLVFHAFVSVAYFTPLLGSTLADNFFGRYRVILWVSVVYVAGHVFLTLGAVPGFGMGVRTFLDFFGLFVIALATGGIKPCVSAFGADQFEKGQTREIERFFSYFYLSINAGSLLAIIIIPLLRGRVSCLGSTYCYPLAFGVPGILMVLAFFLFLLGTPLYRKPAMQPNVIWDVVRCVALAVKEKFKPGAEPKHHWLDHASPKYERKMIDSVKTLTTCLMIFAPVVVFWALFDQQGSTWVLQARRMNGRVGRFNVLPDQVQLLNPIFIIALVPLINVLLPFLRRRGFNVAPLRRMGIGGFLAAASFCCAGFVQLLVSRTLVTLAPAGHTNITIFSEGLSVPFTLAAWDARLPGAQSLPDRSYKMEPASGLQERQLALPAKLNYRLRFDPAHQKCNKALDLSLRSTKEGDQGQVFGVFPKSGAVGSECPFLIRNFSFTLEKTIKQKYRLYALLQDLKGQRNLFVVAKKEGDTVASVGARSDKPFLDIDPGFFDDGVYEIGLAENAAGDLNYAPLRTYTATAGEAKVAIFSLSSNGSLGLELRDLIPGNSVPIFYQLPQFFLMSLGEVLFSVSGLEFSYTQAAPSMKSVLQAFWLLTTGLGNSIDMIISGAQFVKDPAGEFFLFAALMVSVMIIFCWLAYRYKYVEDESEASIEKEAIKLDDST